MTSENIEVRRRPREEPAASGWSYRPRMDVLEGAEEFTILADLPGTTVQDIDISFENRVLSVRGKVPGRQGGDVEFLTHEYGIGDFDREIVLSDAVDGHQIAAEYDRGVLTIHLPKSEQSRPRRIPVRGT